MSEKGIKMYDAVTDIRDDIVEQAADYKFRKSPMRIMKPLGIAASICIAGGVVALAVSLSGSDSRIGSSSETGVPCTTAPSGEIAPGAAKNDPPKPDMTMVIDENGEPTVIGIMTTSSGVVTQPAWGAPMSDAAETTAVPTGIPAGAGSDEPAWTAETTEKAAPVTSVSQLDDDRVAVYDENGEIIAVVDPKDLEEGNVEIIVDGDNENPGGLPDDDDGDAYPGGGGGFLMLRGYDPPVLPLTVSGKSDGVNAERELTFDLTDTLLAADLGSAWVQGEEGSIDRLGIVTVNDSYTLTDTSGKDRKLTLMYPFECSLNALEGSPFESVNFIGSHIPSVTVDGKTVKTDLNAGGYSGKFSSASYPAGDDKSNLDEFYSAEDYLGLLKDGTYLRDALAAAKTIDEPVVVYRIHDYGTTIDRGDEWDALTLGITYKLGTSKNISTFGFNGYEQRDDGTRTESFFLPKTVGGNVYTGDRYIIVRGGDIEDITLCGYKNGFCMKGEEVPEIYGECERLELTYGEMLSKLFLADIADDVNLRGAYDSYKSGVLTEKTIYDAVMKYMCRYGEFADKPIERYAGWGGRMESEISDAVLCERIMYAVLEVTIPAGGSVSVNVSYRRYADMNESCDNGLTDYGLQMYPTLGSTLDIPSQSVTIKGIGDADITKNDFGAEPAGGELHTELDPAKDIYELRFIPASDRTSPRL